MAKIKRKMTTITDRAELEQVMGEYAAQVLERDRLTVAMEQQIQQIRAQYEPLIAACVDVGDGLFDDLHAWAALHPAEFGARKSIELLHGTIGLRNCPPSVKQIRGVKCEHTLVAIKASGWNYLIRSKESLNKDEILARRTLDDDDPDKLTDAQLKTIGVFVERGETFFADVKRENEND